MCSILAGLQRVTMSGRISTMFWSSAPQLWWWQGLCSSVSSEEGRLSLWVERIPLCFWLLLLFWRIVFPLFERFWSPSLPYLNPLSVCQVALWLNISVFVPSANWVICTGWEGSFQSCYGTNKWMFENRLFIATLTKSMYSKALCFMYRRWLFAEAQFQELSINIYI